MTEEILFAARLAVRANRTSAFDEEINDLISAARAELAEIGLAREKCNDDKDPLIKQAIILYVKANFGLDNPDSEKYAESFRKLKMNLSLTSDYTNSSGGA